MEQEIELREIFFIIRKRFWMMALITVLALITSAVISFYFLTPVYKASTTLMVVKQDQSTAIDYRDIQFHRQLVQTYGQIIQSRTIARQVIGDLRLDLTPAQLQDRITVSPLGDTEIVQIDVEDPNPHRARMMADQVALVFMGQIGTIMQVENVSVIDPADLPGAPFKPRPLLNTAIAGVLGVMLGLGLVFLLEYLDNTIKTPDDVTAHLELPVLGGIPVIDMEKEEQRARSTNKRSRRKPAEEVD